ncbi:MAG: hypothetical protein SFT91_02780 [Rickettsiaceae bacterium]|nr:hypothetical protein [Rickettsiaceae bacterium]
MSNIQNFIDANIDGICNFHPVAINQLNEQMVSATGDEIVEAKIFTYSLMQHIYTGMSPDRPGLQNSLRIILDKEGLDFTKITSIEHEFGTHKTPSFFQEACIQGAYDAALFMIGKSNNFNPNALFLDAENEVPMIKWLVDHRTHESFELISVVLGWGAEISDELSAKACNLLECFDPLSREVGGLVLNSCIDSH